MKVTIYPRHEPPKEHWAITVFRELFLPLPWVAVIFLVYVIFKAYSQ